MNTYTLRKKERLCHREDRGRLFAPTTTSSTEGSRKIMVFPVRAVYCLTAQRVGQPAVQVMFSVPKRCFKRAVKRNRVKRQLREAYRHLKQELMDIMLRQEGQTLLVAFIWTENRLYPSVVVHSKMEKLLCQIADSVASLHND